MLLADDTGEGAPETPLTIHAPSKRGVSRSTVIVRTGAAILAFGLSLLVFTMFEMKADVRGAGESQSFIVIAIPDSGRQPDPPAVAAPAPLPVEISPPPPLMEPDTDSGSEEAVHIPPVDWSDEAARVARTYAEADADLMRKAKIFAQRNGLVIQKPDADVSSSFRWSRKAQRIQTTADGLTLFFINDRCVLVNFLIPACAVGSIEARGDLFKDMKRFEPAEAEGR
jgi:hypothetical protein